MNSRLELLSRVGFPPGSGLDPMLREEPGQPISVAQPPQWGGGPEILNELLPPQQQVDPMRIRSAMMYLEAARRALEAAVDELPALRPLMIQVDQLLGVGVQNVLSRGTPGRGFPIAQPPAPEQESDYSGNIPLPQFIPETL